MLVVEDKFGLCVVVVNFVIIFVGVVWIVGVFIVIVSGDIEVVVEVVLCVQVWFVDGVVVVVFNGKFGGEEKV